MGGAAALFSREGVFSSIPVVFWCQKPPHYLVEREFFRLTYYVFKCHKFPHYLICHHHTIKLREAKKIFGETTMSACYTKKIRGRAKIEWK